MMNLHKSLVFCLALFGSSGCLTNTDKTLRENPLIAEIEFTNAGGHWIGVPVSMGELERTMLMDTGATVSVFGSEFEDLLGPQTYISGPLWRRIYLPEGFSGIAFESRRYSVRSRFRGCGIGLSR